MFERYNESARRVLFYARQEVSDLGSQGIAPAHLLVGVIRDGRNGAARMLAAAGVSEQVLRQAMQRQLPVGPRVPPAMEVPFEAGTKRALELAGAEADALGQRHIGPEHLLMGVLRAQDPITSALLAERGVQLGEVRRIAASGATPAVSRWLPAAADVLALNAIRERLQRAENEGNADVIAEAMAEDVVVMVPNEPVQEGRQVAASFVRRMLEEQRAWFDRTIEYVSDEVGVHGDVAFDRGRFSFEVVTRHDGARSGATGKYLWLYSRDGAGHWRVARAVMSLDDPPEADCGQQGADDVC